MKTTTKSSTTDLVTVHDRAAEEAIVAGLGAARPDDAIVGEEGTNRAGTSGISWFVDPIDGTTNFVYDLPLWSTSIAATDAEGALVGAVYAPALGELFAAARGRGATLDGRPIGCSDRTEVALALVGTGFSYLPERRRQQAALVAEVIGAVRDVRRLGSAALDLCFVAAGRYDAYFETGLNSWDAAAGELIAREAGCRSRQLHGRCGTAVGAARLDTGDLRGDGRAAPPLPRGDLTGPARFAAETAVPSGIMVSCGNQDPGRRGRRTHP